MLSQTKGRRKILSFARPSSDRSACCIFPSVLRIAFPFYHTRSSARSRRVFSSSSPMSLSVCVAAAVRETPRPPLPSPPLPPAAEEPHAGPAFQKEGEDGGRGKLALARLLPSLPPSAAFPLSPFEGGAEGELKASSLTPQPSAGGFSHAGILNVEEGFVPLGKKIGKGTREETASIFV